MKSTVFQADKAGPFWAVLGAPLVGVPLMVAVLALGSGTAVEAAVDQDPALAAEHAVLVDATSELDAAAFHKD